MSTFDLNPEALAEARRTESEAQPPEDSVQTRRTSLRSLAGQPAPDGSQQDARTLLALPKKVREAFWTVLLPYLHPNPTGEQKEAVGRLCDDAGIEPQALVGPIRLGRFLISSAARQGLSDEDFVADLAELADADQLPELLNILLPCYQRALPPLRTEIVAKTIAQHGNLVQDTHWRLDNILSSEHGEEINTSVAVMTIAYRDGSRDERITLHFLPDQLAKIRDQCNRLLGEVPTARERSIDEVR